MAFNTQCVERNLPYCNGILAAVGTCLLGMVSVTECYAYENSDERLRSSVQLNYCYAGDCVADGSVYSCGVVQCQSGVNRCGCACISAVGAAYPKGYCGDDAPQEFTQRAGRNDQRKLGSSSPVMFNLRPR